MISLYQIKPKFQQLLKPVLDALYKMGVTANMITWWAIFLSFGTGVCIFYFSHEHLSLLVLPVALLVRMALNALDGMMARTYNMQSKQGEILNEVGDIVSDVAMFAPIFILFSLDPIILLIFLFLAVINEFTGVLAKAITGVRRYDGPMGKSDRAFLVGLVSLILFFSDWLKTYVNWIFIVAIILLVVSTGIRIRNTIKPS